MFESRLDQIDNALSSHPSTRSDNRATSQVPFTSTPSVTMFLHSPQLTPSPRPLPPNASPRSPSLRTYHQWFGQRAFRCGGAPCPMFCPSSFNRPKKRPSVLHEIEAWRTFSDSSPLFFVREHRLNIHMLVDTGAACSLLPLSCIDHRSLTNADCETLTFIGLGSIPVFGISLQRID